jgi:L-ascorbate metabolism protein UlaG (beta-lactamase superfamily)
VNHRLAGWKAGTPETFQTLQPKLAIPMHYGAIVGSAADAEEFRKLVKGRVEILQAEP